MCIDMLPMIVINFALSWTNLIVGWSNNTVQVLHSQVTLQSQTQLDEVPIDYKTVNTKHASTYRKPQQVAISAEGPELSMLDAEVSSR
jgi:hypothetical protein